MLPGPPGQGRTEQALNLCWSGCRATFCFLPHTLDAMGLGVHLGMGLPVDPLTLFVGEVRGAEGPSVHSVACLVTHSFTVRYQPCFQIFTIRNKAV